jgi:hypothetical protein
MKESDEIKQLIPADGWFSVFATSPDMNPPFATNTLCAWALVHSREKDEHGHPIESAVMGVEICDGYATLVSDGAMDLAVAVKGFLGYTREPNSSRWLDAAKEYFEREKELKAIEDQRTGRKS